MVPARDRKVERLPSSLLGRQSILAATTSREINPATGFARKPGIQRVYAQSACASNVQTAEV